MSDVPQCVKSDAGIDVCLALAPCLGAPKVDPVLCFAHRLMHLYGNPGMSNLCKDFLQDPRNFGKSQAISVKPGKKPGWDPARFHSKVFRFVGVPRS